MAIGKRVSLAFMKQPSSPKAVYALTGFLGCKSDWDFFQATDFGVDHLISIVPEPTLTLEAWGSDFSSNKSCQNILLGYSLGGRLTLHALLENPLLWKAAIIVSAHPGLTSETEKNERLQKDQKWADRFLSEDWDTLLSEWNSQAVLKASLPLARNEKDYDRKKLAQMLQIWSLGKQANLREGLSDLSLPILWITGGKDVSYTALSQTVTLNHPLSCKKIISQSGHRVPWDNPISFKETVSCWLKTVLCE